MILTSYARVTEHTLYKKNAGNSTDRFVMQTLKSRGHAGFAHVKDDDQVDVLMTIQDDDQDVLERALRFSKEELNESEFIKFTLNRELAKKFIKTDNNGRKITGFKNLMDALRNKDSDLMNILQSSPKSIRSLDHIQDQSEKEQKIMEAGFIDTFDARELQRHMKNLTNFDFDTYTDGDIPISDFFAKSIDLKRIDKNYE